MTSHFDYRRASRLRRGILIYALAGVFCALVSIMHAIDGRTGVSALAAVFTVLAAFGAFSQILARAFVLANEQMNGFAAVRFVGGFRAAAFKDVVPELILPNKDPR